MINVIIIAGYVVFFLLGYEVGKNVSQKEYRQALQEMYHKLKTAIDKPAEKPVSHCPKCGDEVLGDEDGLCARCV